MNWKALTRFEKVLLAILAAAVAGFFLLPSGSAQALCGLLASCAGIVVAVKLARRGLRAALWRLRHRLLVTYTFIGVAPVLLIGLLTALAAYTLLGQLAIYLVTSEFERRTALMISVSTWLAEAEPARRGAALAQTYPVLEERLPGLEILVQSGTPWRHPADSRLEAPAKGWGDSAGLLLRGGSPFLWAHIVRPNATATALVPVTSRFLTSLAPNLGQFTFARIDDAAGKRSGPIRLLPASATQTEDPDSPRNRVPGKASAFDIAIQWFTLMPAHVWESPGLIENVGVTVRTRPSAVLSAVFAQRVDLARGIIPAVLIFLTVLFLLAEVISLIIGVSLTRTITGAVHDLYEGTERVREGQFSHRIEVKGNDQLAVLGDSFNSMTANIERLMVVAKDKERLQAELEIAREVQSQLFPRALPELQTLRVDSACSPARMVSGDYYDYQMLDGSKLALCIGDVAGKGISAALLMATIQSALRTQLRHPPVTASGLVSHLNQFLYAHTAPEKYATFFLCLYDEKEETLRYTNAGHLPPLLLRGEQATPLDVNGIVVGAFPFATYNESQLKLERGDLLLFYTDGITEPENAYGEQFGEQRLIEILKRKQGCPPAEILLSINEGVREWTGAGELQDDMTLLLAQRI